jgi:hypothetical protein
MATRTRIATSETVHSFETVDSFQTVDSFETVSARPSSAGALRRRSDGKYKDP